MTVAQAEVCKTRPACMCLYRVGTTYAAVFRGLALDPVVLLGSTGRLLSCRSAAAQKAAQSGVGTRDIFPTPLVFTASHPTATSNPSSSSDIREIQETVGVGQASHLALHQIITDAGGRKLPDPVQGGTRCQLTV